MKKLYSCFVAIAFFLAMTAPLRANLEVTKSIKDNLTTVPSGQTFTYKLQYRAASITQDFYNAYLLDTLPEGLDYISLAGTVHVSNFNFNSSNRQLRVNFVNPLPAGSTGEIEVNVRFKAGVTPNGTPAVNTVTMAADGATPFTSAPVTITATAADKVSVKKTLVGSSVPLDQNVTFQVQAINSDGNGSLNASNVIMVDTLPVGSVFVSASNSGVYDSSAHTVTWPSASLNAGSTLSRTVTLVFPSSNFTVGQNIVNNLDVTYTPLGGTAQELATTCPHVIVAPLGSSEFTKSVNTSYVYEGKEATKAWTFTLKNKGNVPMNDVVLTDEIPNTVNVTSINTGVSTGTPSGFESPIEVFYKTSVNSAWTAAPGNPYAGNTNKTINVSSLGLTPGAYITAIQWKFGTLPVGYQVNSLQFNSTLLTTDRSGNPVLSGHNIVNTGTLDYTDHTGPHTKSDSASVPIKSPRPVARLTKSASPASVNDGDSTTFTVKLENRTEAAQTLVNPVVADLLNSKLVFEAGSWAITDKPAGAPDPVFEVINNYKGTGSTLLRWSWTGASAYSLPINDSITMTFRANIPRGTIYGGINNDFSLVGWQNTNLDTNSSSSKADSSDLDDDGNTSENIIYKNTTVTVLGRASMDSVKWVKGELDSAYSKYPASGFTVPGGKADYRLIITNTGNVPIQNAEILDILPFVGDTGVIDTSPRLTEWIAALATSVNVPAGVTTSYSRSRNPHRTDYVTAGPVGSEAPYWNLTAPATLIDARSVKFNFDGIIIQPGASYELNWSMRAPVGTPTNGPIAWNSFGFQGTRTDTGGKLLASEPIKVGIEVKPDENASYGDRVWLDTNRNGIQDEGEVGLNGINVRLYEDSGPGLIGDGIQDTAVDRLVGTTITADDFYGRPGYYLFPNLDRGNYYAVFEFPAGYGISPRTIGDPATDSNGDLVTGVTSITDLEAQEVDLTWDQGLFLPPTSVKIIKTAGTAPDGEDFWTNPNTKVTYTYTITNTGELPLVRLQVTDDKLGLVADINGPLAPGASTTVTKQSGNLNSGVVNIGTVVGHPANDNGLEIPGAPAVAASDDAKVRIYAGVGDFVWFDDNRNGVQDSLEAGVPNVVVSLYSADGNFIESKTTGNNGKYLFYTLPGDYYVQFAPPAGFFISNQDQGSDGKDSDVNPATGRTISFTLLENQTDLTWDLGIWKPASLGNYVWIDEDRDGQQDGSELGLNGVIVKLLDFNGDPVLDATAGQPITMTTANDTSGKPGYYEFSGLYPTTYSVEFVRPSGYRFTDQNKDAEGVNGATNSDADIETGRTETVALAPGEHNPHLDAGVYLFDPIISITKLANLSEFDAVGQIINYSFVVRNEGNVPLTNVTVIDSLITVLGGPIDLAVGQTDSTTFHGTYTVTQADLDAGERPNTASVRGLDPDGDPVVDDSSVIVDAIQRPGITITKTGTFRALPGSCENVLGIGAQFNAFIYGNLTANGGDTDARLAVAGNAMINGGYSVGTVVKGDPLPIFTSGLMDMFIVGNDLHDGNWGVNGNIVYGGTRYGPARNMPHGNLIRQVIPVTFAANGNVVDDGSGRTFVSIARELAQRSAMLAAVADRGVVVKDGSSPHNLILVGGDPQLNVFNLTSAEWNSVSRNLSITAPATATVLINVSGNSISLANSGISLSGVDPRNVLYNYVNAKTLSTTNFAHLGSVLAPYATSSFSAGSIDGRALLGGDVTTNNGFEFHNFPFTGNICFEVLYQFTVANTGNVTLHDVAITDPLVPVQGGPIILAPGVEDSTTFTAVLVPTPDMLLNGVLSNTAQVVATAPLGDPISATDTHELTFILHGAFPLSVISGSDPGSSGGRPDFIISAIQLDPVPAKPSDVFAAKVTIVNSGNASGNGGVLRIWLDKADEAATSDIGSAEQNVGHLEVGQSTTLTFTDLTASSTLGTYTFRAFVDASSSVSEASEGNNQRTTAYTLTEEGAGAPAEWMKPDFVISAILLNPVPVEPGDSFSASVTIENQGDIPGQAGTLRAWASHSPEATVGEVGDASQVVGLLAVGESRTVTFSGLTAPTTPNSTAQFRAFINADGGVEEKSTGNNQLTRAYHLADPDPAWKKPDFIVQSVTLTPSPTIIESTYTAVVRVKNVGDKAGNAGTLKFWAQSPSYENLPALPDSTSSIGALDVGQTVEFVFDGLRAPAQMGTYHSRAIIEAATEEYSTDNNQGGATYTVHPLQVELKVLPNGHVKLTWESAAGYVYYVERTNILGAPFILQEGDIAATPPLNEWIDTNPDPSGAVFYRVTGNR